MATKKAATPQRPRIVLVSIDVFLLEIGAGKGNRTLVISLEGCGSTIELHPRGELTA